MSVTPQSPVSYTVLVECSDSSIRILLYYIIFKYSCNKIQAIHYFDNSSRGIDRRGLIKVRLILLIIVLMVLVIVMVLMIVMVLVIARG